MMLVDAVLSMPLWILVACVICAVWACMGTTREIRTYRLRWLIVLVFTLATSVLWANPWQMLFRSGPFSGEVIDAEDGKPVPIALLAFEWGGTFGATHGASALTTPDGKYHLAWQGLGNWHVGAWPRPSDSFCVLAPGYAAACFYLDGVDRDLYGNFDATARSASRIDGQIRLQRLHGSTKFNIATRHILQGVRSQDELRRVARKFYDASYPRLCAEKPEWEPTDLAFSQLYQLATIIDRGGRYWPPVAGTDAGFATERLGRLVVENQTPRLLDPATIPRLCSGLQLPEGGVP